MATAELAAERKEGGAENQSISLVFHEDVVRRKKRKKGKELTGIVIKTARNDNDSDSSDDEDEEEHEKLEEGTVMIGWHSLNSKWNDEEVEILPEKEVYARCIYEQYI